MQFFRKHLVLQQALAQQAKKSASKGDPQSDESIYYASNDGESRTTASSKSENVDSHPTESSASSYSGYNHLHGLKTSFVDADAEQLNIQVTFDIDSIFLFVTTILPVISVTISSSLSQELFSRQTHTLPLQTAQVLQSKRAQ